MLNLNERIHKNEDGKSNHFKFTSPQKIASREIRNFKFVKRSIKNQKQNSKYISREFTKRSKSKIKTGINTERAKNDDGV